MTDTALSGVTLLRLRRHAASLEGDSTEAITGAVRNALSAQPALIRRILHAFPDASLYNRRVMEQMRARKKKLEAEIREARTRARTAMELKEKQLQQSLSRYRQKPRR